jgi:hypothetical protein
MILCLADLQIEVKQISTHGHSCTTEHRIIFSQKRQACQMLESNIQIHIRRQAIHPVRRSNGTTAARKV